MVEKKTDWQAKMPNPSEDCKDFIGVKLCLQTTFTNLANDELRSGGKGGALFGINEGLAPFCRIIQRRVPQFSSGHHQPLKSKWGKSFIFKPASAEIRLVPRSVDWCEMECLCWCEFQEIRVWAAAADRFIVPGGKATPCALRSLLKGIATRECWCVALMD